MHFCICCTPILVAAGEAGATSGKGEDRDFFLWMVVIDNLQLSASLSPLVQSRNIQKSDCFSGKEFEEITGTAAQSVSVF